MYCRFCLPPHFFRLLTKFSFLFAALSALLTVSCPNPQDDSSVSSKTFTITNTGEWNSAIEAVKNGGDNRSYTLVIDGTVSVPGTDGSAFGAGVSVTVQGSGELALASPGRIFTLGAGQTLILGETGGSGPTLRG
ncbi:MAG: hypothetical protein LBP81_00425, partial [Treponema sp.]|nr:hypothetical protein [Treponema sp.]